MPTEISTHCFHTHDSIHRSNGGSFTFNIPSGALRNDAAKVALASCEFPMVQQTIEPEWNRFYYAESLRLNDSENFLEIVYRVSESSSSERLVRLALPPFLNRGTIKATKKGRRAIVHTVHEHNLFRANEEAIKLDVPAFLIGLNVDFPLIDIKYIDAFSFEIDMENCNKNPTDVFVCCDAVHSPVLLCKYLTQLALSFGLPCHIKYDDCSDRLIMRFTPPDKKTKFRVKKSYLASFCGLSSGVFYDEIPSEAGRWFTYGTIPCGFYSPCHRPMGLGQPRRFGNELERSLNPLYFPLLAGGAENNNNYIIVFSHANNGEILTAHIPAGRYTVESMCDHLSITMTRAAAAVPHAEIRYSCLHENNRFRFLCEEHLDNNWEPAIFSLLFHHPLCVEAERFGFPCQPLSGQTFYTAPMSVTPPNVKNIVRVCDTPSVKGFSVHATSIPPIVGIVSEIHTDNTGNTQKVTLVTYLNRRTFVSGLIDNDVVGISSCNSDIVMEDGVKGTATHPLKRAISSVVLKTESSDVAKITLTIPNWPWLVPGMCILIQSKVRPWNMHFGKSKSVPAHMIGWPRRAVIWGRDGSIDLKPPFVAPFVHNLDHPDYVCLTFSESGGADLEHTHCGLTKQIFCKLSLYPQFREERMLPRDTKLKNANLTNFTLSFWNPDMQNQYAFHGAEFSFSLAFFSAVPSL